MFWNLGTLLGALAGTAIDPKTFGLDAAFPAAYVAMVWPLLRDRQGRLAAALGAVICLALIPFVPVGHPDPVRRAGVLVGVPPMTWTLVVLLAAGAYFFKVLGLVVIGDRPLPPVLERCLAPDPRRR